MIIRCLHTIVLPCRETHDVASAHQAHDKRHQWESEGVSERTLY
eukprot:SAG11_NODE_18421_length_491_cov_3.316327_1_plen_43_part_10